MHGVDVPPPRHLHRRSLARGRAGAAGPAPPAESALRRRPARPGRAPGRRRLDRAGRAPARDPRRTPGPAAALGHPRLRGLDRPRAERSPAPTRGLLHRGRDRPARRASTTTLCSSPSSPRDLPRPRGRRLRLGDAARRPPARPGPARRPHRSRQIAARGRPAGWTNRPVVLAARATDPLSGMDAGDGRPLHRDPGRRRRAGDSRPATRRSDRDRREGVHRVAFYARDAAGNVDDGRDAKRPAQPDARTVTVRIDRSRPGSSWSARPGPAEPEMIEARVADRLSGPDPLAGIDRGPRRPARTSRFAPLPTDGRREASSAPAGTRTTTRAGSYEFRAIGYDAAGNSAATLDAGRTARRSVLPNPLKVGAGASGRGDRGRQTVLAAMRRSSWPERAGGSRSAQLRASASRPADRRRRALRPGSEREPRVHAGPADRRRRQLRAPARARPEPQVIASFRRRSRRATPPACADPGRGPAGGAACGPPPRSPGSAAGRSSSAAGSIRAGSEIPAGGLRSSSSSGCPACPGASSAPCAATATAASATATLQRRRQPRRPLPVPRLRPDAKRLAVSSPGARGQSPCAVLRDAALEAVSGC